MNRPLSSGMPRASLDEGESLSAPRALSVTVEGHIRAYFAAHEHGLPASGVYDRVLREIERPLLRVVMEACEGNQLRAAELLGLNRNTLRKKLRELGLAAQTHRREKGVVRGSLG